MSVPITFATTPAGRGPAWWRELFQREPRLAAMAWLSLMLVLPCMLAMLIDTRTTNGVSVWLKPAKFAFSFVVYYATLAWFFGYLRAEEQAGRAGRFVIAAAIGAGLYEMTWLLTAAFHGVPAHFNVTSPRWALAYAMAGVGAVTLMLAVLVQGILIARRGCADLHPAFKLSLVLGAVVSFVLTVVIAGYLSSRSGHWVGAAAVAASDAGGLPLLGWSRSGGDLRVAHFFALHAQQAIPLAGFLVTRAGLVAARGGVWAVAVAYAALTLFIFSQALGGKAFLAG